MRLREAVRVVKENKIFIAVIGYVKVIEFRKRGLVQAQLIFIFDNVSNKQLVDPAEVDK